jgi:erythritol kinase (D-erythritol 1-phosphate-forming)
MTTPVLIALDSGTSVVKAVAFGVDGTILTTSSRPNVWTALPGGGAEQDMRRTWDDAASVLAELSTDLATRIPDAQVAALGVTAQGDGTWLIDADGEPVGDGLLWLDARAASIVEGLNASGAARAVFAYTGTGLAACQQAPQLLWLDRHRTAALARATTAFHPKDYLYFRLTGARATSPCEGNFTFGNFRTRAYQPEVIAALGLSRHERLLPPIVDGTLQSHALSPAAAALIGLPEGLPVVLGYVDVLCTALGAGLYGAGDDAGVSVIGSTGMHIRLVPHVADVAPSAAMTGYCMPFPVPGHTIQAQTNMAATLNIDWLADIVADATALSGTVRSRADVLRDLGAMALTGRAGAALFQPFISTAGERGPFTDAFARASLIGLDQSVRLQDLARAVFEGLCFAARDCYAAIGGAPADIRLTGGAARSPALRTLLAAALDRPVRVSGQPEAGAAGAAMMAAVRVGLYSSMAECAAVWVAPRLEAQLRPDPALVELYDRLFPLYRDSYAAMPSLWRRLHAVREASHAV